MESDCFIMVIFYNASADSVLCFCQRSCGGLKCRHAYHTRY